MEQTSLLLNNIKHLDLSKKKKTEHQTYLQAKCTHTSVFKACTHFFA